MTPPKPESQYIVVRSPWDRQGPQVGFGMWKTSRQALAAIAKSRRELHLNDGKYNYYVVRVVLTHPCE